MASTLKYPVVLMHGYMDDPKSKLISFWKATEDMLHNQNIEYLTVKMPPFGSIKQRSEVCKKQIRARYPNKTVHLIAHSMGGLNARDIAARPDSDRGFYVKSVTTYGTPHNGVPLIDKFFGNKLSQTVHAGVAAAFKLLISNESDHGALQDMSCERTAEFNRTTDSNPDVTYLSWAGHISPYLPHILSPLHLFIRKLESDGLIEVSSAEARGLKDFEFLGVLEGVDHVTMMGPDNVKLTIPYLKDVEAGSEIRAKAIENGGLAVVERRFDAFFTFLGGLFPNL